MKVFSNVQAAKYDPYKGMPFNPYDTATPVTDGSNAIRRMGYDPDKIFRNFTQAHKLKVEDKEGFLIYLVTAVRMADKVFPENADGFLINSRVLSLKKAKPLIQSVVKDVNKSYEMVKSSNSLLSDWEALRGKIMKNMSLYATLVADELVEIKSERLWDKNK